MSVPAVIYAYQDGVATLTLNRALVLNALNDELLVGLRAPAGANARTRLRSGQAASVMQGE